MTLNVMVDSTQQTVVVLRRRFLDPSHFQVDDSRGYRMDLRIRAFRERGRLNDGEHTYLIEPDGKRGLIFSVGDDQLAEATGELGHWKIETAEECFHIKMVKPIAPRADITVGGSRVGDITRVGFYRKRITVRIEHASHPAILGFIGSVAIIAWRRIAAEASYQMWWPSAE